MKISGSNVIDQPVDKVWEALLDPRVLVATIPGCERLEATGDHQYAMTVTAGVAAIKGTYDGEVRITDQQEPHRFVLRSREAAPFSEDGSGPRVHWQHTLELTEADGATTLTFTQAVPAGAVGADMVAGVGPGWDYYLDRLVTAAEGGDPGQIEFPPYLERSDHYRGLFS